MSKSYQHEIPQARVNITLDVESNGAKSKKELPMKLLILGDYSHGQANGALASRERLSINKHNFNQIMATIAPKLHLTVPDKLQNTGDEMQLSMQFDSFDAFKPGQIIEQIPQLQRLMAMRNLLKDLKSCVIDNQSFRKALERIMKDDNETQKLIGELASQSPLSIE